MKKQSYFQLSLTLAATMIISASSAQSGGVSFNASKPTNEKSITAAHSSSDKVNRSFFRIFSSAENISWKETPREFIASFKMDDRPATAWFTKSGYLYCTNYYGTGKHLPAPETAMVEQDYPEYEITATVEVVKNNTTAYVVTVQSRSSQKKVKLVNGELEEMESLKLAR